MVERAEALKGTAIDIQALLQEQSQRLSHSHSLSDFSIATTRSLWPLSVLCVLCLRLVAVATTGTQCLSSSV